MKRKTETETDVDDFLQKKGMAKRFELLGDSIEKMLNDKPNVPTD